MQIKSYPKVIYILVLTTLIMYVIAKYFNNNLVHRVCQTEFVRYVYYLFSQSFESPVINSETKQANQTKRACSLLNNVSFHKDHIVNISGFYQL